MEDRRRHTTELPEDRDGFRFRGGASVLDLTATLQGRFTPSPRELLASPADLDRWLVSAGLASGPPGATEADLETARALREAIFALATSVDAPSLDPEACKVLNRIAAAPEPVPVLIADRRVEMDVTAAGGITHLAREAVRLFGGPTAAHIRQCESPICPIFFIDTSRSGHRRWCSMAACGNRAKVAALRRRARRPESAR